MEPVTCMAELADILRPLAELLQDVSLEDPAAARAEIEARAPFGRQPVQGIRSVALEAAQAGWLLPREQGGIRFGRVCKDVCGFSVDAVLMDKPGPRHRHPNGEIDLCFTTRGDARFDGQPEGWVVYGPESAHVPTVSGGEMLILYFLPQGAIVFGD